MHENAPTDVVSRRQGCMRGQSTEIVHIKSTCCHHPGVFVCSVAHLDLRDHTFQKETQGLRTRCVPVLFVLLMRGLPSPARSYTGHHLVASTTSPHQCNGQYTGFKEQFTATQGLRSPASLTVSMTRKARSTSRWWVTVARHCSGKGC